MNCDQIEELLSDLIDDELSDGARACVEQHLTSCERCSSTKGKLLRTVRFVRSNSVADLAPGTPGGAYAEFSRAHLDPADQRNVNKMLRDERYAPESEGDVR